MLSISIIQPASQGKEQEPILTKIEKNTGSFNIDGVTFELKPSGQEAAKLNIKLAAGYDAWINGDSMLSIRLFAITQLNSRSEGLRGDFTGEITLENFELASKSPTPFNIMKDKPGGGWQQLSQVKLTYTPDLQGVSS